MSNVDDIAALLKEAREPHYHSAQSASEDKPCRGCLITKLADALEAEHATRLQTERRGFIAGLDAAAALMEQRGQKLNRDHYRLDAQHIRALQSPTSDAAPLDAGTEPVHDWAWALAQMKAGKSVRHSQMDSTECWHIGSWRGFDRIFLDDLNGCVSVEPEDLERADWQITGKAKESE